MKTAEEAKQYFHDYYEKNKAHISTRQNAYYEKNKEAICLRNRAYDNSHKEQLAKSAKKYAGEHKEEITEYMHGYYLENQDTIKQRSANRRAADPEAARLADAQRHAAHPEKAKAYRKENAEAIRLNNQKRHALQLVNTPKDEVLTLAQWREVEEYFDHSCAYCGRKMERLTVDHIVPLTQGGKHTKENVVPACQHCNSSKYNRTPLQWVMSRGFV